MACAHATAVQCVRLCQWGLRNQLFRRVLPLKGYIYHVILRFFLLLWYLITIPKRVLYSSTPFSFCYGSLKSEFSGVSRQYEHKLNWERYVCFLFVCVVHNLRKEISTSITKRKGFKLTKSFQYKGKEWFGSICCHSVIISIFFLLDSTVWFWMYICACV